MVVVRRICLSVCLFCSLLTQGKEPLVVFGLLADVQYADRAENSERDYRGSKDRLAEAIEWMNTQRVSFTVSLGDWVDRNLNSYDSLTPVLGRADSVVYPVLGNHEVYEFRVDSLAVVPKLRSIGFGESYFYAIDRPEVRLLVLNTNKNAMTDTQLLWIEAQLEEAQNLGKLVVVLSHHPLVYKHIDRVLAHRSEAVCALLGRYKNTVKACFAGHFHYGGYHCRDGIHHYVVQGMVQKQSRELCLKITIFGDRMHVEGPREVSTKLKFNNLSK